MPQVTEEKHSKFTKRISKNDIRPKDGSEPLTVIEFSLTNEVRDSLKAAIDEYCKESPNEQKLAQIIRDHFPSEILTELSALAKKSGASATVYIVHNLPKDMVPENLLPNQATTEDKKLLAKYIDSTYTNLLSKGIGIALRLNHKDNFYFSKKVGDNVSDQNTEILHKHSDHITMLGGVLTGGSQTRFVDLGAIMEDSEAANIHVVIGSDILKAMYGSSLAGLLSQIKDTFPDWHHATDYEITTFDSPDEQTAKLNAEKFETLVDKHSQRTIIGSGDLALWAEDNRLYHQALPGVERGEVKGWLGRLAIGHAFNRPENER